MPEIAGTGDNWFISHHQEGYLDVLEVALPSNRRVGLEYIQGGDGVGLKVLKRFEDKAEKWEALAVFDPGDLDGIASLFVKARELTLEGEEGEGGWRPLLWLWQGIWRPLCWLWRMVFGRGRRDKGGTIDDMFERVGFADGAGRSGEQDRLRVPADGGGGGGDRPDGRAPSADGPGAA